ncbi:MAG: MBL fold metallo-hydrolase [Hoeflea sp.]|nr:MBL fold metallo-hydrolase [Hoeflea sp.]
MTDFFTIDMLPAREGDCIWIEYGDESQTHRILIDGGRSSAYDTLRQRFDALPDAERELDLLVCTHVDADHIEGLLKLIKDPSLPVRFRDVWFNGYVHLTRPTGAETFGAKQGEQLTDGIVDRQWSWNGAFGKQSVVVGDNGPLPVIELAGGMRVTLLSPHWPALESLRPIWKKECEKAGLIPGVQAEAEVDDGVERFGGLSVAKVRELAAAPYKKDTSKANGSSIALLLEYGGKTALLAGDAHGEAMEASIGRLTGGSKLAVDVLKLSHHGSQGTLPPSLLDVVDCESFLVSTDGSRHDHPDREAIARLAVSREGGFSLIGNYRSAEMLEWDQASLKRAFGYSVQLPGAGEPDGIMRHRLL